MSDKAQATYAISQILDEYHDRLAEYCDAELDLAIIAGTKPADIDVSDVVTRAINRYHADLTSWHVGREIDDFMEAIKE